jgi:large subunit ribosomal protein L3
MAIVGILGKKIGMTQLFINGVVTPVTAVQAGPCYVTQVKTVENDGYEAVQIGFDEMRKANKPEKGHMKNSGKLFRHLREYEVDGKLEGLDPGTKLDASLFKDGDIVDVVGTSKGKGFAGVMKRHGFGGMPRTRGHPHQRIPGSIGNNTFPSRIIKGRRMAGHMGMERVKQKNLVIVKVDAERNLLFIRGAVPGASNGLVSVEHAINVRQREAARSGKK